MADDPFAADLARKGFKPNAEPFPWETEGAVDPFAADLARKGYAAPDRIGAANQSYDENLAALRTMPLPTLTDRLKQTASTVAGGAKAIGNIGLEEAKSLPGSFASVVTGGPKTDYLTTNPAARRELVRGVSDAVTFGLAEKAGRKVGELTGDTSFDAENAQHDAEQAPGVRTGGALAGSFLPSPASILANRVAKALPAPGVVQGAARGVAQYEATAPVAAAIQSEGGLSERAGAALDAATDPAGIMLSGGAGAAGALAPAASRLLAKKAQNRMVDQAIKDIAGSRETGMSKPTDRRLIARMAEPIREELREPDGIKIADTARKDPGKAWEMVKSKVDAIQQDRAASYAAVDAETGGFGVGDLRRHLTEEITRLGKSPGQATERTAVEAMLKDIDETWGQKLSPRLPTLELRQYVTRLQRVAADTMGGLEETRRVQILDHVSGLAKDFLDQHLDAAAKADPGLRPVVDGLRDQNRRVAAWLSLEDALKTRASKLETNNMVDNKPKTLLGGLGAAAAAQHFLHSPGAAAVATGVALAPYVLPPADRAITRGLAGMTPGQPLSASNVARLIEEERQRRQQEP